MEIDRSGPDGCFQAIPKRNLKSLGTTRTPEVRGVPLLTASDFEPENSRVLKK
jgi:hypothetical protein